MVRGPGAESLNPEPPGPVLALDAGSPVVSVAVALAGQVLSQRSRHHERSSGLLLQLVEEVLSEARVGLGELGGVLALRGPGSFTGLRIGLATALGFHQATGVPATATSSLGTLAAQVSAGPRRILAVVDALRGEWFVQAFDAARSPSPPIPSGEPEVLSPAEIAAQGPAVLIGFGVEALRGVSAGQVLQEALPLAPTAAELASLCPPTWQPCWLTAPLYLRAAAAVSRA